MNMFLPKLGLQFWERKKFNKWSSKHGRYEYFEIKVLFCFIPARQNEFIFDNNCYKYRCDSQNIVFCLNFKNIPYPHKKGGGTEKKR